MRDNYSVAIMTETPKLLEQAMVKAQEKKVPYKREELEKFCLFLGGFCQPHPYLNLHQMLGTSDDGFLDRISSCIVDSVILTESEVKHWNDILDTYNITTFDGR